MENQHRKIKGYRDLSQEEIDLMNEIKEKAAEVGDLVSRIQSYCDDENRHLPDEVREFFDKAEPLRWVAIGKTDLQKGFMALTRSIAKPGFF